MSVNGRQAIDLLARLVEDRNNTLAGVADDCHGTYCVYCGARSYGDKPRPDHHRHCPVEQGQRLLARIYGEPEESEEATRDTKVREIPVNFPG